MQANEFEKNIQATMESFSIKPNDAVWNNVANRIAKKEKRRRAIFWFFSTAILCGAIGLWIFSGENKNNSFKNEETTIAKKSDKINAASQQITKAEISDKQAVSKAGNSNLPIGDPIITKNGLNKNKSFITESKAQQLVENKNLSRLKFSLNNTIHDKPKIIDPPFKSKVADDNKLEKAFVENNNKEESISKSEIESTAKNLEKPKIDSNYITQETLAKIVADTMLLTNNSLIKQPSQKSKWKSGITILAGISDNLQFSTGKNMDANSSLYIPPVSTYADNTSSKLSFTTSFSFGIGGFISKPLNKRFDFSVGVNYHFYQTSSRVGNKINRSASNFNAAFLQDISINDYYTYDNIAGYKNNYHLLQMPILVSYKMNKNTNHNLRLSGGIAPGYLVGTKALFDNKGSRILYEDKKQFHHFNISVNAGAMWGWKNKNGNEIEVGPVLQYQINNLVKPVVSTSQHLFFTGIKTNFFFK